MGKIINDLVFEEITLDDFISKYSNIFIIYNLPYAKFGELIKCYHSYMQLIENSYLESGFLIRDKIYPEVYYIK